MSYDLMVFEPEAAPKDHQKFLEWYTEQTKWSEGHSYDDPAITSERLRHWYSDITRSFPSLNGIFSEEELPEDKASATDYSIGKQSIYACFSWSKVEIAYQTVFDLAVKHELGFFNVSPGIGEVWLEEVWLPQRGELILAHQKQPLTLRNKFRRLFGPS